MPLKTFGFEESLEARAVIVRRVRLRGQISERKKNKNRQKTYLTLENRLLPVRVRNDLAYACQRARGKVPLGARDSGKENSGGKVG